MITLFNKFKKTSVDKYVILCYVSRNNKHIVVTSEDDDNNDVTVLTSLPYYKVSEDKVRIFNDKNVDKFVKIYNKRYNFYKFEKMKYEYYILDIETNKYNL